MANPDGFATGFLVAEEMYDLTDAERKEYLLNFCFSLKSWLGPDGKHVTSREILLEAIQKLPE